MCGSSTSSACTQQFADDRKTVRPPADVCRNRPVGSAPPDLVRAVPGRSRRSQLCGHFLVIADKPDAPSPDILVGMIE